MLCKDYNDAVLIIINYYYYSTSRVVMEIISCASLSWAAWTHCAIRERIGSALIIIIKHY